MSPLHTSPLQGGSRSDLAKVRTCCTWDSKGEGDYPPPVPLLCPARGSERSGPGGWYDSMTSPDILLRRTPPLLPPWGRRPGRSGFIPWGSSRYLCPKSCCTWQWITRYTAARFTSHLVEHTLWRCWSLYVMTSPVILYIYASNQCIPMTRQ